jgi:hypothetical protein
VYAIKEAGVKRLWVLGVVVAAVAAVPATSAWGASPHEVNNNPIVCHQAGTAVECSGSIAGLGNADAVRITVTAGLACETKSGSNQPGGHLQGTSQPIPVRSGRVNFDVTTASASCPPGLRPVVGDTATVTVRDASTGEVLFRTTVPIT